MAMGISVKNVNTIPLRIEVIPIYNSFFFEAIIKFISSMGDEPHEIIVRPIKIEVKFV